MTCFVKMILWVREHHLQCGFSKTTVNIRIYNKRDLSSALNGIKSGNFHHYTLHCHPLSLSLSPEKRACVRITVEDEEREDSLDVETSL